jgi:hypothetical protein
VHKIGTSPALGCSARETSHVSEPEDADAHVYIWRTERGWMVNVDLSYALRQALLTGNEAIADRDQGLTMRLEAHPDVPTGTWEVARLRLSAPTSEPVV